MKIDTQKWRWAIITLWVVFSVNVVFWGLYGLIYLVRWVMDSLS